MVSPLSLCVLATVLLSLAVAAAWLRRTPPRDALADGLAALVGVTLVLGVSAILPGSR